MRTFFITLLLGFIAGSAGAESWQPNFIGPLVTPNAMALPSGLMVLEPYLIYSESHALYDARGERRTDRPGTHQWLLVAPLSIGITDRITAQVTPGMTYNVSGRNHSDGVRKTDTGLILQYMLTTPKDGSSGPAFSISFKHNFTTGKYNRLGDNPLNGTGSGASSNRIALLGQQLFWLTDNHPLRLRFQAAWGPSPSRVRLHGTSSHGTTRGFLGAVSMGTSMGVSTGLEYGLTRQWVLAADLTWNHRNGTRLRGTQCPPSGPCTTIDRHDGPQWTYGVAPAMEYNFSSTVGLIFGMQWSVAGHNANSYWEPQAALSMVF